MAGKKKEKKVEEEEVVEEAVEAPEEAAEVEEVSEDVQEVEEAPEADDGPVDDDSESFKRRAHDEDAKKPLEEQRINHTVCGVCEQVEEEEVVEEEAGEEVFDEAPEELVLDHVVTERDTHELLPTHRRVMVTAKTFKKNPGLAKLDVKVGDVIQVRTEDAEAFGAAPEGVEGAEDLSDADGILEVEGGFVLRLKGEVSESAPCHRFLGNDAFKNAVAEFKRLKGV